MKTQRDELSTLMYSTLTGMPDASLTEKADVLASIAMAHLTGADDRLEGAHRLRREKALTRALGEALRIVEQVSVDLAVDIATDLEQAVAPLDGPDIDLGFTLNCTDHVVLFPPIAGTLGELRERLTDFFARQHHEPRLARERAEAVLEVIRLHIEGEEVSA